MPMAVGWFGMFIEVLRIIISWPVVIGAFLVGFRNEIKKFILNISEIWFPGGGVRTHQLGPPTGEPSAATPQTRDAGTITLDQREQAWLAEYIERLGKKAAGAEEGKERVVKAATALFAEKDKE